MYRKIIILNCFFIFSCVSPSRIGNSGDMSEGYKFISYYNAGSTSDLRNFYITEKNNIENKRKLSATQLAVVKEIFKSLKWKKHFQKKITGIEVCVELSDPNCCNFFVFTNKMVIDIIRGRECNLTRNQNKIILENFK